MTGANGPNKPLKGRIALVTGASRGIGYASAKALAAAGAHVIAIARTVGGLEELDDDIAELGGSATLVPLDLRDVDGIDRLGPALAERYGKLDILLLNAGVLAPLSPLGHIAPKAWDEMIAVNLTANWRLVRALDPLLRQSDDARIIALTSDMAQIAKPFWGTFAASKAALEALLKAYAGEMESSTVRVALLDPGPTATALRAKAMPGEDKSLLNTSEDVAEMVLNLCEASLDPKGSLYDGRRKILRALTSHERAIS